MPRNENTFSFSLLAELNHTPPRFFERGRPFPGRLRQARGRHIVVGWMAFSIFMFHVLKTSLFFTGTRPKKPRARPTGKSPFPPPRHHLTRTTKTSFLIGVFCISQFSDRNNIEPIRCVLSDSCLCACGETPPSPPLFPSFLPRTMNQIQTNYILGHLGRPLYRGPVTKTVFFLLLTGAPKKEELGEGANATAPFTSWARACVFFCRVHVCTCVCPTMHQLHIKKLSFCRLPPL